MKKNHIKYLLFLLLVLPLVVFADLGGPAFPSYEAFINDRDGAYLYRYDYSSDSKSLIKTDIFFAYNTSIHVEYEEKVNNDETYAVINYKGPEDEYNEEYYINLDKISIYKQEYTLEDLKKDSINTQEKNEYSVKKAIVVKETKLYYGPSTKYGIKNKKIEVGIIFKIEEGIDGWYYVTSDKYTGWLSDNDCIASYTGIEYWFLSDTKTYSEIENETLTDVVIPSNSRISNVYLYGDNDTNFGYDWLYVSYNDNMYWVKSKDAFFASETPKDNKYVAMEEIALYDIPNGIKTGSIKFQELFEEEFGTSYYNEQTQKTDYWDYVKTSDNVTGWVSTRDKKIGYYYDDSLMFVEDVSAYSNIDGSKVDTIKAGTIVSTYYRYTVDDEIDYYYFNNNGKYVYVRASDDICEEIAKDYGTSELEDEKYIYDKPYGTASEVLIPAKTELWFKYNYQKKVSDSDKEDYYDVYEEWYYVESKNYTGWIYAEEGQMKGVKENIEKYEQIKNEEKAENNTNNSENKEPDKIKFDTKLTKRETLIVVVACAIILGLVIIVIIVLVNKKRKIKASSLEEANELLEEEKKKVEEIESEIKRLEEDEELEDNEMLEQIQNDLENLDEIDDEDEQ